MTNGGSHKHEKAGETKKGKAGAKETKANPKKKFRCRNSCNLERAGNESGLQRRVNAVHPLVGGCPNLVSVFLRLESKDQS